jgi:long-chain acyl-CoA synthetase
MIHTNMRDKLHALWQNAWPSGLPCEPHYPHGEVPLFEYLRAWARQHPAKAAIIFYGREISYQELDDLSDRFANALIGHGVTRGDRVSVMLSNCPQFHIAFFGILKCGAVYAPVSPLSTAFELEYQLRDAAATALVVADVLMPVVREAIDRYALGTIFATRLAEYIPATPTLPVPKMLKAEPQDVRDAVDFGVALALASSNAPAVSVSLDDMAALNYTGGTTGLPKGCVHTHGNMIYTAAANYHVAGHSSSDVVSLNFFPEFWIAGENNGLIFPVFGGCTLVLLSRWDPLAFMAAVDRYRVQTLVLQVDGAADVLDHSRVGQFNLRSLRHVRAVSFVKKLNVDLRHRWRELTGSTLISNPYGMTETHAGNTFTLGMQNEDFDLNSTPIFVGLPVPGADLKICSFETGQVLELGAEGEICVHSPSMMKTYWNAADAFDASVKDGWLHTGDIGVIDDAGYIHYLGRHKEMLKVKGMSVFPSEIEAIVAKHPAVQGCAVIGTSDDTRGEVPVAFVVLREDFSERIDPAALEAWCSERMAFYKVPQIKLLDTLPLTATGKVRKDVLITLL